MINCELCDSPATIYCHADDAHLCWSCDREVHAVNFLVARHIRTLLCRSCQSLTPWMAAGANLGRTVSVCRRCVIERNCKRLRLELRESEADCEDSSEVDADLASDEGFYGQKQVVPLSPATPPPDASSSSCISNRECPGRSTRSEFSEERMKYLPKDSTVSSCGRKSRRRREYISGGDEAISVDSLKEQRNPVKAGSRSEANIKRRRRIGGSFES